MPMTFDTYSNCAFKCLYCFSQFQRGLGACGKRYRAGSVSAVNPERVMKLFRDPSGSAFEPLIRDRVPLQWGGLSDPFDEVEREHRIGLRLLRFFREIQYPICFSTKGTWWTEDAEYVETFRGAAHFNVKVSIITLDPGAAKVIEVGVPSPLERLLAIQRIVSWGGVTATLRLRPFIIGISSPRHTELIDRAADAGATALSTEFLCVERRAPWFREKLRTMSRFTGGLDLWEFYKRHSPQSGYLRLNRNIKRRYVDEMQVACDRRGLRFYVSDAHFKERCANGSCCGLPPSWNYLRGQFTEAIQIAKQTGRVTWSDMEKHLGYARQSLIRLNGGTTGKMEVDALWHGKSTFDYIRSVWNSPMVGKSPMKMYEGILMPEGLDANGNVVYRYNKEAE